MATFTANSMTNHHGNGPLGQILQTVHAWHDRYSQRAQLARLNELELHDIGLSHSLIAEELDKPFWRA